MDFQRFAQSIIDTLLSEKRKAAQYAAGDWWGGDAPALAQGYAEEKSLAEASDEQEKAIQGQKLAADLKRTRMGEEGALERTKLSEAGATGRTRMGEEGALERARLTDEGATGRTRMTEAGALERAKLADTGQTTRTILGLPKEETITPMQEFIKEAPNFMSSLAQTPGITPEMINQGMQMYWTQASALSGEGSDLDFAPVDQPKATNTAPSNKTTASTPANARSPMPPAQKTSTRSPLSTPRAPAKKPASTPQGAPTPFAPKSNETPNTPWEKKLTGTFPAGSGLHALGRGAQTLGETGVLQRFPEGSILGGLHERYYR